MKSQFTYSVPKAVGVKKAGIPAPPARMRSARVPCNDVKHKYLQLSNKCHCLSISKIVSDSTRINLHT